MPLCLDSLESGLYLINKIEACLRQPRNDTCGKNGDAFHLYKDISVELKEVCLHNNLVLSKGRNHNYKKILKSDCLSTVLISALTEQWNSTVHIMAVIGQYAPYRTLQIRI